MNGIVFTITIQRYIIRLFPCILCKENNIILIANKEDKTMAKNETTSNKKEFTMEQVFAMWINKAKSGMTYFTGKIGDTKLVGYTNGKKKNPKEPDIRIYTVDADHNISKEEYISLWVNVSKNNKKYLSGKLNDKKVVGWFNDKATVEGKIPYFTVYYSDGEPQKPEEFTEPKADADLPF